MEITPCRSKPQESSSPLLKHYPQVQQHLPWRAHWTLRDLMMHVLSFPALAWLSHQHGSMSTDDMRASNARLREVMTCEAIAAYGEGVRQHILAFLQSNDTVAFDRVVPAHDGGEVTVLALLTIIEVTVRIMCSRRTGLCTTNAVVR